LTLDNLDKINGGQNGGYSVILTGKGFPLDAATTTITICGQKATITSIDNIKATIIVPSCPNLGPTSITISDGVQTSNALSF
jgi:hypothetical protein